MIKDIKCHRKRKKKLRETVRDFKKRKKKKKKKRIGSFGNLPLEM